MREEGRERELYATCTYVIDFCTAKSHATRVQSSITEREYMYKTVLLHKYKYNAIITVTRYNVMHMHIHQWEIFIYVKGRHVNL